MTATRWVSSCWQVMVPVREFALLGNLDVSTVCVEKDVIQAGSRGEEARYSHGHQAASHQSRYDSHSTMLCEVGYEQLHELYL